MGGINPYVYVENNPINDIDPLGLNPALILTMGGGGATSLPVVGGAAHTNSQSARMKAANDRAALAIENFIVDNFKYIFMGGFGEHAYDTVQQINELLDQAGLDGPDDPSNPESWKKWAEERNKKLICEERTPWPGPGPGYDPNNPPPPDPNEKWYKKIARIILDAIRLGGSQ